MEQFKAILRQLELNGLNTHNRQSQAAKKIWQTIAPAELLKFTHAGSIKNHELTVLADNNAVAAKLKLLLPSLLIQLKKQECEVTAIRVKVQVKSTPQTKPKALRKLSPAAVSSLKKLSSKLSGTMLGDALDKLSKNTG